jgi:protein SCO1/2
VTRGFLPLLGLVITAGLAVLGWETDGFRVATTEGARRLALEHHPPALPDVVLIDQDGVRFSPAAYRGRVLLVDFIYTGCASICGLLGEDFTRVLGLLQRAGGSAANVDLLSISFDPAHDTPPALKAYGARFDAVAPRWRIAIPASAAGLHALLQTFGVVVIPDAFGGFTHNDALYLVDRRGRLVRILDRAEPASLVAQAVQRVP